MNRFATHLLGLALAALLMAPAVVQAQPDFTVTVQPKTQNHPYFGQGEPHGYAINGVEGMELTLERGQTYVFQMSDVPFDHPFYISTDPAGAGAGIWNAGVDGNFATGNATLTFTVPEDAPDELWYQCAAHLNMGYRINVVGGIDTEPGAEEIAFAVRGPAPNPFESAAVLTLDLPVAADVVVHLFDLLGRRVAERHLGRLDAGRAFEVVLGGEGLAAGLYVYRLEAQAAGQTLVATGRIVRAP